MVSTSHEANRAGAGGVPHSLVVGALSVTLVSMDRFHGALGNQTTVAYSQSRQAASDGHESTVCVMSI